MTWLVLVAIVCGVGLAGMFGNTPLTCKRVHAMHMACSPAEEARRRQQTLDYVNHVTDVKPEDLTDDEEQGIPSLKTLHDGDTDPQTGRVVHNGDIVVPPLPLSTLDSAPPPCTGLEWSGENVSVDPATACPAAKVEFFRVMQERQSHAAAVERMQREVTETHDAVKALQKRAECEQTYRSTEDVYRKSGIALAQVCP